MCVRWQWFRRQAFAAFDRDAAEGVLNLAVLNDIEVAVNQLADELMEMEVSQGEQMLMLQVNARVSPRFQPGPNQTDFGSFLHVWCLFSPLARRTTRTWP